MHSITIISRSITAVQLIDWAAVLFVLFWFKVDKVKIRYIILCQHTLWVDIDWFACIILCSYKEWLINTTARNNDWFRLIDYMPVQEILVLAC